MWIPRGHVGGHKTPLYGVIEILVRRQCSGRCGAALEGRGSKVAWFGLDPLGVFTVAIALRAVAADAKPAIELLATAAISDQIVDVTLLRKAGWYAGDKGNHCG
jgi:hypothetical protein